MGTKGLGGQDLADGAFVDVDDQGVGSIANQVQVVGALDDHLSKLEAAGQGGLVGIEVLEPILRKGGVANGVLDVDVP